jgi:hypothetical protein
MSAEDVYRRPRDTMRAISAAARRASPALGVSAHDLQTYLLFDRFLARVFREPDPAFMVKGGTRMLAWIPSGRSTLDIDLESARFGLDEAIAHLQELVATDIGDRLRFRLTSRVTGGSEDQPNLSVAALRFAMDDVPGQVIKVDLAVHNRTGMAMVSAAPRFRVPLGKPVPVADYTMITIEQQIADKAAAMMERNHAGGDGRSSRAKYLVDLALVAMYLPCDARSLRAAVREQIRERDLHPFVEVDASASIQERFASVARSVDVMDLDWRSAQELVNRMLRPALDADVDGTWDPSAGEWISPA